MTHNYSQDFEQFWKVYPRHEGKLAAWRCWKRCRREVDERTLLDAARRYAAKVRREGTEQRYIKLASTFLGPDRHWEEALHLQEPLTGRERPTTGPRACDFESQDAGHPPMADDGSKGRAEFWRVVKELARAKTMPGAGE